MYRYVFIIIIIIYYRIKYKKPYINTTPFFSVLIPLYNNERYIEGCINSVINQTFQDFEIIIIDDFSQDNSFKIANKISNLYKNKIRIYKNENNLGVYKTLNKCLKLSNGKYICILGSDDKFHISRLKEDYKCLQEKDIVMSKYIREKEEINKYYNKVYGEVNSPYTDYGESMITLKRSIFNDIGPFLFSRFGSDTEFGDRIKLIYGKDSIFYNNKVLYFSIHKKDESNLTIKYSKEVRGEFIKYYKLLHTNYKKKLNNKVSKYLKEVIKILDISIDDHKNNLSILKIEDII